MRVEDCAVTGAVVRMSNPEAGQVLRLLQRGDAGSFSACAKYQSAEGGLPQLQVCFSLSSSSSSGKTEKSCRDC